MLRHPLNSAKLTEPETLTLTYPKYGIILPSPQRYTPKDKGTNWALLCSLRRPIRVSNLGGESLNPKPGGEDSLVTRQPVTLKSKSQPLVRGSGVRDPLPGL